MRRWPRCSKTTPRRCSALAPAATPGTAPARPTWARGPVMPVLHPYMGGARGTGHAADYAIADPHMAYVMPARALAAMVVDLLWDGAGRAREVVATAKPALTRDAYVKFQRDIRKREVYES